MSHDAPRALAYCLKENPDLLKEAHTVLFIRAEVSPALESVRALSPFCLQTWKPHASALEAQRFNVITEAQGSFDLIVYLGTKFRDENLYYFALGEKLLTPGGIFLCAMDKDIGARRFEKNLEGLFGSVQSSSKYMCRVFWAKKGEGQGDSGKAADWLARGAMKPVPGTELKSQAGVFSHEKIDSGSALLAAHLPRLAGKGGDFGAGYGFLSHAALASSPDISELHLLEAEDKALQAARINLALWKEKTRFHWCDATRDTPCRDLDWILMNPPFHEDKKTSYELGQKFIRAAAGALRAGGVLYLVFNDSLPYMKTLREMFKEAALLAAADGYTVVRGEK